MHAGVPGDHVVLAGFGNKVGGGGGHRASFQQKAERKTSWRLAGFSAGFGLQSNQPKIFFKRRPPLFL
jgi:hypothetical protein